MNYGQQLIKENNEKTLFRLVREHTALSRADLKRLTGLSPTTVSSLADELISKNLLIETGIKPVETSGRKAMLLQVNPKGGYFICVDIKNTVTIVEALDLNFNIIKHHEIETTSLDILANKLVDAIRFFAGSIGGPVIAITAGFLGIVKGNKILSSIFIDTTYSDVLIEKLENCLEGVPFFIKIDSSLIAYAHTTVYPNAKNIISVDLNKGVGAGILINGAIFSGAEGLAGEFGHISIDKNGPECPCTNRGCLELYTNIDALVERAKKTDPSVKDFIEIATNTDKYQSVIYEIAEDLSFGLVNIINLFNPEKVIISGTYTRLGEAFLEPLKYYTNKKLFSGNARIEYSPITCNATILGGAKFAFDQILI